jgi:chemotaxis protein histidine kinase CheA
MTAAVERGMRLASVEFAIDVIRQLNSEGVLTCGVDEAMKLFDFDGVSVVSSRSKASKKRESAKSRGETKSSKAKITAKPSVVLPFCGVIVNDWCAGVKFNHGLHTQCTQGRCKGDRYCKTCRKHADNSATGKPPYGDIEDRAKYGVDYRDPKGKQTIPYANIVEKMGISLEAAHAAATTLSWTIPAEQLVKRVAKRGRPAKSAAVSDTDSETDGESSMKKKRGRPAKTKVVKAQTQEDQIAQLVAEAYAETALDTPKVVKKVVKKAKKPKMTAEEKAAAKLAKKEAAEKVKAEKKAEKEAEKAAAKLAKKEAAEKVKAEKKAAKEAEKLAKKEVAAKLKADKLAAKKLEKEQKAAAKQVAKAKKLALAKAKAAEKKAAKKSKTAQLKVPVAEVKPVVEAKTVVKEAVVEADLFLGTDDVTAQQSVMPKSDELDFEEIDDAADSSDDEDDEGLELSETMTVAGVEYFFTEQDGQTILFTKAGEPVGIYDADTDTVQECEFDDE